jgi:hypothetical protein
VQAIWLIVLSAFGAIAGLVKLIVLPACMRHPERIERIELFGPGDVQHMHVILDDGSINKLLVDKADRDGVKAALLERRNAIVLRARVVQR